jgi:hypothetical protein
MQENSCHRRAAGTKSPRISRRLLSRLRRRQVALLLRLLLLLAREPPLRSVSSEKSIIMIAFFFTMPMSRMMPTIPYTVSSWCVIHRARSAPNAAKGRPERIVTGR